MIRVVLPYHLRTLAKVDGEVELPLSGDEITIASTLDALESKYPVLRGAIREITTQKRRPFVRYFACKEDLSHEPSTALLPPAVISGDEPLLIVGAMSGG
jgi:sulfur-carrier protein